jgi:BsuBI/PstI restriction endonuclease domain
MLTPPEGDLRAGAHAALLKLITDAGSKSQQAAFLTAFQSRDHGAFEKTVGSLAWGSFAWCFSEPEHLIAFDGATPGRLARLSDGERRRGQARPQAPQPHRLGEDELSGRAADRRVGGD